MGPLPKGKGSKCKCYNYRGISLLSITGKVSGGIATDSVVNISLVRYKGRRRWVHKMFTLRTVKKTLDKKKNLYTAFTDLKQKKTHDKSESISSDSKWCARKSLRYS